MTMKTMKLAAVALVLATASSPALAGKGGSAVLIQDAITSTSQDAIIAELERTESLMCPDCVPLVTRLLSDARYPVREAAGWWFSRRPGYMQGMTTQMLADLQTGDAIHIRNAADYLGATVNHAAIPAMTTAFPRGNADAKLAIVRAIRVLTNPTGNPVLVTAMSDGDASVRAAAASAWREIRNQTDATPVIALLGDSDAKVRAQAATVVGALHGAAGHVALEALVTGDSDSIVRRNAVWALGQIGLAASRTALTAAVSDSSGLVRGFAKAALLQLH
jgi:HEAT repeat protein